MDESVIYQALPDRLLEIMKNTFGTTFKAYYRGDPIQIPKDAFPALIVSKITTDVNIGKTSSDRNVSSIRITIVLNKRDDFNASVDVDLTDQKLERYVEGRDPATGEYLPGTVLYGLRSHLTLGTSTLSQSVKIRYDLQPRPYGQITSEAQITIQTTEDVLRPEERPTI